MIDSRAKISAESLLSALPSKILVIDKDASVIYDNESQIGASADLNSFPLLFAKIGDSLIAQIEKSQFQNKESAYRIIAGLNEIIKNRSQEFSLSIAYQFPSGIQQFNILVKKWGEIPGEALVILEEKNSSEFNDSDKSSLDNSVNYKSIVSKPGKKYLQIDSPLADQSYELKIKDEAISKSATAIAFADLNGKISFVNEAFVKLWGFENENEVIGMSNIDLGSSPEKVKEIMMEVNSKGKCAGQDTAIKKDGTYFDIYFSTHVVKNNEGLPIATVGTFIDITDIKNTKRALRQKTQILESSAQLAQMGSWQIDLTKNTVHVDEIMKSFFGILDSPDYMSFEEFTNLFYPDDQDNLKAHIQKLIGGGDLCHLTCRFLDSKNSLGWIDSEAKPVTNEFGKVTEIMGVSQDVTAHENAKLELARSEAKAKIMFDYSPIMIWEEDFSELKIYFDELKQKGITNFREYFSKGNEEVIKLSKMVRFVQINQATLDFYNLKSMDELVSNLSLWFVDDSWGTFREEVIALAEGKSEFTGNVLVKGPDGTIKYFDLKLSVPPMYMDTLEVVLVSFMDFTDLKNNEELLKEKEQKIREYSNELEQKVIDRTQELANSEANLKVAQEIAKMGYWEWSLEDKTIHWSDEMYKIYEIELGKIKCVQDFIPYIHPDDLESLKEQIREIVINGSKDPISCRVFTGKGKMKYIHTTTVEPIKDSSGKTLKIIGVSLDVTKLKEAENMRLQVDAVLHGQESERERIAAELHDSINPLLSIASLNIESIVDKEHSDSDKMKSTVSILNNAIQGIREISSNLSPAVLKNFGLVEALEQLCKRVEEIGHLNIEFQAHRLKDKLDFEIELGLYRIAQELLNNSLKYSQANEIQLQLVRHEDSIVFMISDDGVGFNVKEVMAKSEGFGLTNMHSRVQTLNGTLNIDSSIGKGSIFVIEIPI